MRELLLMRHAKSSWEDATLTDHERPLNPRGQRAAVLMGRFLTDQRLIPDLVITSSAKRAETTAEMVVAQMPESIEVQVMESLYHAPPEIYSKVVASLSTARRRVLIIGHNPGMEVLIDRLRGHAAKFPTAAVALVSLSCHDWQHIDWQRQVTRLQVWRPKQLVAPR
jgi:phosphohistidine phosphatase